MTPKMYATGARSSHLGTKRALFVRNWNPECSLGDKTGLNRTQLASDELNNNSNQVIL